MLISILLVAAFILFVLATFNVGSPKFQVGWAGAACLAFAYLLTHWPG